MLKYKNYLFDLDGTLTDPGVGIRNSIKYALEKFGLPIPDDSLLNEFIGPPLMESYKKYFGFTQEEAELGLKTFREYFSVKGIFENKLFDGMYDLLEKLYEAGYELVLATSKPDVYAGQILEHFGIKKFFTHISACPMDEADTTKLDIIKSALELTSVKNKSEILMIGDTHLDINGAMECGIDSIGVLYGTDGPEELKSAIYIAKDVEELKNILL